jgi:hypothetical protein
MKRWTVGIAVLVVLTGVGRAESSIVTIYEGGGYPKLQGWLRYSDNGLNGTVSVTPNVGPTGSALRVETTGDAVNFFYFQTGAGKNSFALSTTVNILNNASNPYDFGFGLAPFVNDPTHNFAGLDRTYSLVPANNALGWADQFGGGSVFPTAGPHVYSLLYKDYTLTAYVDSSLADVIAGIATPVLSRTVYGPSGDARWGYVGFGDMTNDPGVNSLYEVESVQFADLGAAVPEPTTLIIWSLLGAIAIVVGWRRRKAA